MNRFRTALRRRRPLSTLAIAFAACTLGAQTAPLAERALQAFTSQAWSEALPLYEQLAREAPDNAIAHLRLGVVRLYLGEGRSGLAEIDRAAALGAPAPQVEFRRACAYAVLGDESAALDALDRALTAGFGNLALLQSEPLLAAVRPTPRFAGFVERIDRVLNPCKHEPKCREFDYWVGTWDVVPSGASPGTPPSTNVVTLEHGDCIVHEHWKGTATGESFNLYDASRGAWFQTWVDSTGGMHEYRGGLDANGNMAFTAELAPSPGQATNEHGRVPTRLTFLRLPTGQVRQLSEQSTDGGATWQVAYDLIYTRRKE